MSSKHPVIAVTGSSGAGTTTVKRAFENIFRREKISAAVIEGDSLHSLDRMAFRTAAAEAAADEKALCLRQQRRARAALYQDLLQRNRLGQSAHRRYAGRGALWHGPFVCHCHDAARLWPAHAHAACAFCAVASG